MVVGWVGWARSHFFIVCWKRSTLPWVWGCQGRPFFWSMPRRRSSVSRWLRPPLPPASRVVKTIPLSVRVEAGIPCSATVSRNAVSTIGPVTRWWAVIRSANREWSSSQVRISLSSPGTSVGVGEPVVGEVGLPALVRHRRFEADVGGLRPLLRLRGDQASSDQLPGHRGPGHGDVVVMGQMPADGLRAGVQTLIGQFLAEPNDQVHDRQRRRVRVRPRTPGAGLEDGLALAAVAGEQLIQPRR
jgi:hypothetical protein